MIRRLLLDGAVAAVLAVLYLVLYFEARQGSAAPETNWRDAMEVETA